jgi:hypothetical protein
VTVDRDGVHLGPGDGRAARAIVREEAVHIAADGEAAGTVVGSAFRGPGHLLEVQVPGGVIGVRSPISMAPGAPVRLVLEAGAFTVLDG